MKRGQITIFVVMGIVLVIIAGLLIYVNKTGSQTEVSKQIEYTHEESMVSEHVEFCLSSIAEEGLRKIGSNGGYISPQEFGIITIEGMPTISSSLSFAPNSNYIVPYWYYMKSSNSCENCFFDSQRPPISADGGIRSVERQLSNYVTDNVVDCIDLTQFKAFSVEELSDLSAEVVVGDSRILVSADYSLLIKSQLDSSQNLESFQSTLDIDLKSFFNLADDVLDQLVKDGFFERVSTELIAVNAFSGSIPPLAGPVSIDFKPLDYWIKSDVKDELQVILADNIPEVQVVGFDESVSFYDEDNPYRTIFYQNMIGQVASDSEISEFDIDFIYLPWWEPYLKVTPSKGEIIMEDPFMSFFGIPVMITNGQYSYDLSYPIVTKISDEESLNGRGFSLVFAFEVNMRNNGPFEYKDVADEDFDDISLFSDVRPMFPNPAHWNSGDITIKTVNKGDGSPVSGVALTFNCVGDEAFLGVSKIDESGDAVLKTKLPACVGGIISGFRNNYFITSSFIDIIDETNQELIVYAEQKKLIAIDFKEKIVAKEPASNGDIVWAYREGSSRDLALDENVIAIFTRVPGINEEDYISQVTVFGNVTEDATLELVSGQYTFDAYVFKSGVVIPEEEICADDECVVIEEMDFNGSFYAGGLTISNETSGTLNISFEDLHASNKIEMNILVFEPSDFTSSLDLEVLDMKNNYTVDYMSDFGITFINSE